MSSPPVVLITGASSGIGRATAQRLIQRGYRVFGTSRHPERTVADGATIELLPLDVTSADSVAACIQTVLENATFLKAPEIDRYGPRMCCNSKEMWRLEAIDR